jgi:hypothetical protein
VDEVSPFLLAHHYGASVIARADGFWLGDGQGKKKEAGFHE